MTASNFQAAPTGPSTITRFLKPRSGILLTSATSQQSTNLSASSPPAPSTSAQPASIQIGERCLTQHPCPNDLYVRETGVGCRVRSFALLVTALRVYCTHHISMCIRVRILQASGCLRNGVRDIFVHAEGEPAVNSQPVNAAANADCNHAQPGSAPCTEHGSPEGSSTQPSASWSIMPASRNNAVADSAQLARSSPHASEGDKGQQSSAAPAAAVPASAAREAGGGDGSGRDLGVSGLDDTQGADGDSERMAASWKREAAAQLWRGSNLDAPLLLQCTEEVGLYTSPAGHTRCMAVRAIYSQWP